MNTPCRTSRITLEFESPVRLERALDAALEVGGVLVPGTHDLALDERCELELVRADGRRMVLPAVVVWVSPPGGPAGVGLQLVGLDDGAHARVREFTKDEPEQESPRAPLGQVEQPKPIHERVRKLSRAAQVRLARSGDLRERVALERVWGSGVWDALLHNPHLTPPEVARIARMGTLPIPLIEHVVTNGGWLASPEVRRALLSNPRLRGAARRKVLMSLPKHDLALVPQQSAYPQATREEARRLLRSRGG